MNRKVIRMTENGTSVFIDTGGRQGFTNISKRASLCGPGMNGEDVRVFSTRHILMGMVPDRNPFFLFTETYTME